MSTSTTRVVTGASHRCIDCQQDYPLTAYRVLYNGRRRPLRCQRCEQAKERPARQWYYTGGYTVRRAYNQRTRRSDAYKEKARAYKLAHTEETAELNAAYRALNVEQIAQRRAVFYQAHPEARERDRARMRDRRIHTGYSGPTEARKAAKRAAWRVTICEAVAAECGVSVDECRKPTHATTRYTRHVAVYLIFTLRFAAPFEEVASEFHTNAGSLKAMLTRMRAVQRAYRTPGDYQDLHEVIVRVRRRLGVQRDQSKRKKYAVQPTEQRPIPYGAYTK